MRSVEITAGGQAFQIKAEELNHHIWFHLNGRIFVMDKEQVKKSFVSKKNWDEKFVLSPMPGQIVKILVTSGMEVKENQTLLVLSSMKMEYTLKAPDKGFIKSVKVKEGERVSADQKLVEITKFVKEI